MTFYDQVHLWNVLHPTDDFWANITLPQQVIKSTLIDYLLYEYGDMITSDTNCGFFRNHVQNFFDIHKWNIDELAETLNYEYDPLADSKWTEKKIFTDDRTTDFTSQRDITETETMDDNWTEDDKTDTTLVNYVSGYNDQVTHPPHWEDTEHHRDVEDTKVHKEGTDDRTTQTITNDDLTSKEVMDDDQNTDTNHFGNNSHTFQSLIKEERQQAEFNIYKWIGRHFSRELLVCVW